MSELAVLTIEDDSAIRRGIVDALSFSGYRVLESGDGDDGLRKATQTSYDLLLLDLALPGTHGLEILKRVRQARPTQPIIILTAKGDENDRVAGLKEGADDYIVKPFSIKELLARIEAVLRRSPERPGDIDQVSFVHGQINFDRREVTYRRGERAELSEKETELLRYLVTHGGRAISRDELLANVWRLSPRGITTRTIDMHIARLREKLGDSKQKPAIVLTVRGKGYMWSGSEQRPV